MRVVVEPPLQGVGWEVKVYSSDFTTLLAVNPEYTALQFSIELNSEGSGQITFDMDSQLFQRPLSNGRPATDLLDEENLFEFYENGVLRHAWISETVDEHSVADDLTRTVTVTGPGLGRVLKWATVLPPNAPNVASTPGSDGLAWIQAFRLQPVMVSWLTLLQQSQGRGTIDFVTTTFGALDSAGQPWADDPTYNDTVEYVPSVNPTWLPAIGSDLLTLLNTITGQDPTSPSTVQAEWFMRPGFVLDVRQQFGTHREGSVIFHEGASIIDRDRTRSRSDIANYVMVYDDLGNYVFDQDADSITKYKQRETTYHTNSVDRSDAQRQQMASVLVKQKRSEQSSWTITVPPDLPGRLVFQDYDLGDWVAVESSLYETTGFRVMAIGGQVDNNGQLTIQLTLESLFQFSQTQLQQQLVYIENAVTSQALTTPTLDQTSTPQSGDTLQYDSSTGTWTYGQGGGGGIQVFIQSSDPGGQANVGDFWLRV